MREILYKGKRVDNGEWVYGLPYKAKYGCISSIVNDDEERFLIFPETVGQFTGLTDKNGKKIFEGDIVKGTIISRWNRTVICCEVVYNNDGFISVERTRNQDWVHKVKFAKDIEVIGNIHDNL